MKRIILLLCAFFLLSFQNLTEIRESYYEASRSKELTEKFHEQLAGYVKDNQLMLAYKGASMVLKARFVPKKESKKELFTSGVKLIENAIKVEGTNVEIRLIRLSIQENTPKFLKYKANIEEDKKQIISLYNKQSKELKEYIKKYLSQSTVFTSDEKQKLK